MSLVTLANASDFVMVGSDLVASFATDVVLPNGGPHTVELCFALDTGRGLSRVSSCLDPFQYTLDCNAPVDTTAPTIAGSVSPAANAAGWNNTDVVVSFMCEDFESGIASCMDPVTLSSEDAGQSVMGVAVDNAGNVADTTVSGINIDKTAPSVALVGVHDHLVDEMVSVTCDFYDALSGVESSSCDGASGPAYGFGVGSHAVSASATDYAGNAASASSSFTVTVTQGSLCNLIHQFVNKPKAAKDLCNKLSSAQTELNRGNVARAERIMRSYDDKLQSLVGTAVSAENAMILQDLGQAFLCDAGAYASLPESCPAPRGRGRSFAEPRRRAPPRRSRRPCASAKRAYVRPDAIRAARPYLRQGVAPAVGARMRVPAPRERGAARPRPGSG